MSDIFHIASRFEVLRGNKLMIPGNEPASDVTAISMEENRVVKATVIDLARALAVIPGSTVELTYNPRRYWFILPSGPGPDPSNCDTNGCNSNPDWYQILRDAGDEIKVPAKSEGVCNAFPLRTIFG